MELRPLRPEDIDYKIQLNCDEKAVGNAGRPHTLKTLREHTDQERRAMITMLANARWNLMFYRIRKRFFDHGDDVDQKINELEWHLLAMQCQIQSFKEQLAYMDKKIAGENHGT